ncbi:MAG: hypothetical protein Q4Q17_03975 [Tissierellia bacterium]|nr:hypothetical protein [Tissierellia bacterium]
MKQQKTRLILLIIQVIGVLLFGFLLTKGAKALIPITLIGLLNVALLVFHRDIFKKEQIRKIGKIWALVTLILAVAYFIYLFSLYGSVKEIMEEVVRTVENFGERWFKLLIFAYQPLTILIHPLAVFLGVKSHASEVEKAV